MIIRAIFALACWANMPSLACSLPARRRRPASSSPTSVSQTFRTGHSDGVMAPSLLAELPYSQHKSSTTISEFFQLVHYQNTLTTLSFALIHDSLAVFDGDAPERCEGFQQPATPAEYFAWLHLPLGDWSSPCAASALRKAGVRCSPLQ